MPRKYLVAIWVIGLAESTLFYLIFDRRTGTLVTGIFFVFFLAGLVTVSSLSSSRGEKALTPSIGGWILGIVTIAFGTVAVISTHGIIWQLLELALIASLLYASGKMLWHVWKMPVTMEYVPVDE